MAYTWAQLVSYYTSVAGTAPTAAISLTLDALATQTQSEFALHARAILGLPVDVAQREPGASAVIYGGMDARGVAFDGVAEALAVPGADLRLFGKPEAFERRRMGVALARAETAEAARARATTNILALRPDDPQGPNRRLRTPGRNALTSEPVCGGLRHRVAQGGGRKVVGFVLPRHREGRHGLLLGRGER